MIGSTLGHWGFSVALVVWAYDTGGPSLVGIATFFRILPAAVAAPFLGALADRYERRLVMVISDVVRAASLTVAAVAIATDLPAGLVVLAVAVAGVAASAFYPSLSALLPSLTNTPEELTAANVTTSAIDGLGMFIGPAIGGLLLVATSPQTVFLWTVACLLWSATLVRGVRPVAAVEEPAAESAPERLLTMVREGFAATIREPAARLIVGLFAIQTFIAGYLASSIVLVAFDLLHRGAAWVGYLEAAIGVGGLVGVLLSASLVGRRDLSVPFGMGVVLFGAPLLLVAAWSNPAMGLLAMAIIGIGNALCDVGGVTLLQRATPDAVRARVFSVLESTVLATIALGGLIAPLLADAIGLREALVVGGALPVIVVVLLWRPLRRLDVAAPPAQPIDLLRGVPLLAPLARTGARAARPRCSRGPGRGRAGGLRAGRPRRQLLRDRRRRGRRIGGRQPRAPAGARRVLRRDRAPARHTTDRNRHRLRADHADRDRPRAVSQRGHRPRRERRGRRGDGRRPAGPRAPGTCDRLRGAPVG